MLYFFDKVYRDCWLDEMIEFLVRESCDTYRFIENKKSNTSVVHRKTRCLNYYD